MKAKTTKSTTWFDPQRRAADPLLRSAILNFARDLEAEERQLQLRARRRRDADLRSYRLAAEALVCNLLITATVSPTATLTVPRGHGRMWGKGRYRNPVYGQHYLDLIDLLIELGYITQVTRGYRIAGVARQVTTVRPTRKFTLCFPIRDLTWRLFQLGDEPELLILKPAKDEDGRAEPIDYRETKRTRQWRGEVARLNAWLRKAPIEVEGPGPTVGLDRDGQPIEPYRRCLRRVFNNADWQQGGRLFGGFWMTMEREERFGRLRIAGEPIANVDFSSLFPRLAYVRTSTPPPETDLYDIAGDGSCRDGWKTLINALLFAKRPLKQWPEGTREQFPEGLTLRDAIRAIKAKHAPIAHLFERGLGFELMRHESDMLIDIVTLLFRQGITALPLHDSVLVARSQAYAAKAIMEQEFERRTHAGCATVKIDLGPI